MFVDVKKHCFLDTFAFSLRFAAWYIYVFTIVGGQCMVRPVWCHSLKTMITISSVTSRPMSVTWLLTWQK